LLHPASLSAGFPPGFDIPEKREVMHMSKIIRAVKAALSIRRKDRAYGWWGYHNL
jgi:hypothetical protein